MKLAKWDRTVALSVGDIPHGPDALGDTVFDMTSVRRRGKKPRQRKRRYRPVVDRGCSKKKAHKTQAEAQVVVDQIKARRVFILGLGAPSTDHCGRCGYWHHGSAALELPAISMTKQCATCGQPIEAFARVDPGYPRQVSWSSRGPGNQPIYTVTCP